MSSVRRKYCFENSRNRVQGILPFAVDGGLEYPNMTSLDGNWSKFVADFGYEEDTIYDDNDNIINEGYKNEFFDCHIIEEDRDILRWRYKYKNLMRHYHYALDLIRNGFLLKRGSGKKDIPEVDCIAGSSLSSWWTDFFDDSEVSIFDYQPINIKDIEKKSERLYVVKTNVQSDIAIIIGTENEDYVSKIQLYNDEWNNWQSFVLKKLGKAFTPSKDIWQFCKDIDQKYIGYIYVPTDIKGLNVPDRLPFTDVAEYLAWFEDNEVNKTSCCVKKENDEYIFAEDSEWSNHGGQTMWDFLKTSAVQNAFKKALDDIKNWEQEKGDKKSLYLPPYMEMALSITQSYQDEGVYTPYEDKGTMPIGAYKKLGTESGWVESQLSRVKIISGEGEDGQGMDGVFREYPDGPTYFRCTYSGTDWQHYSLSFRDDDVLPELYEGNAVDIKNDNTKCLEIADIDAEIDSTGMNNRDWIIVRIENEGGGYDYYRFILSCYWVYNETDGTKLKYTEEHNVAYNSVEYYLSLTMKETVPGIYLTPKSGDFVNVLASYQCYVEIPYEKGTVYNKFVDEYGISCGDYIISMDDGHFVYNIGGIVDQPYKRGYVIEEDYTLSESSVTLTLDGVSILVPKMNMIPVDTINSYSESLGMIREGVIRGRLVGITTDMPSNSNPILFKRDGDSVLLPGSKISIDITVERGASAAFESFYKLSECNTMEDLENYGNDYFHLQENNG